jgi:hypothetical protein
MRLGAPVLFACVCLSIGSRRRMRLINFVIMRTIQGLASCVYWLHCEVGHLG